MTELQIINKILQEKTVSILSDHNIYPQHFSQSYRSEIDFILEHVRDYHKVPDVPTFLNNFNDFDIVEVNEPNEYLVNKFSEELTYRAQVEGARQWGELLGKEDSTEAFRYLSNLVDDVRKITVKRKIGTDIIKDRKRLDQYLAACEGISSIGITTGLEELDNLVGLFLNNDLTVIAARTNMGKSFLMKKLAVGIWEQGKKVLFYSGENSMINSGYRFDTILKNFDNKGLMFGRKILGPTMTTQTYENYFDELAKNENEFLVLTPDDFGGDRVDTLHIKSLIEKHKPDVIFLDQLSLMTDHRGKKQDVERLKYSHIMEDLRLWCNYYNIPIFIASQTNRNSAAAEGIFAPPEIKDLSESDAVAHNATKVVTFAVNENILEIAVKKNTNGDKDVSSKMLWHINIGLFMPFSEPEPAKVQGDNGGLGDVF